MSFRLHILLPVSREGKRGWQIRPAVPRRHRHRCRWDRRRQHLEAPRYGVVPPPPLLPLIFLLGFHLCVKIRRRCCRLTSCLSLLGPRSVGEGCLGLLMFPPGGCIRSSRNHFAALRVFGILMVLCWYLESLDSEYILMVLVLTALNLCFFPEHTWSFKYSTGICPVLLGLNYIIHFVNSFTV